MVAAPARDDESVKFQWFSHWYPVLPLSFLETDKPSKYKVLGIDMVLWPDEDGKWRAAKDACPHRCAAALPMFLQSLPCMGFRVLVVP